jgi:hypothetical protein
MENRRARIARCACIVVWMAALAAALMLGAKVAEPGQLLGLLMAAYLGAWGVAFATSPADPSTRVARFLACTAALVACLAPFEAAALFGAVDYRPLFANPTAPWDRSETPSSRAPMSAMPSS